MQVQNLGLQAAFGQNAGQPSGNYPMVSVKGSNEAGIISIIAGLDSAQGDICTIIFTESFERTVRVKLIPKNKWAFELGHIDISSGATSFTLSTDIQLVEGRLYEFFYEIIEIV